jgi:hypothetical protein
LFIPNLPTNFALEYPAMANGNIDETRNTIPSIIGDKFACFINKTGALVTHANTAPYAKNAHRLFPIKTLLDNNSINDFLIIVGDNFDLSIFLLVSSNTKPTVIKAIIEYINKAIKLALQLNKCCSKPPKAGTAGTTNVKTNAKYEPYLDISSALKVSLNTDLHNKEQAPVPIPCNNLPINNISIFTENKQIIVPTISYK